MVMKLAQEDTTLATTTAAAGKISGNINGQMQKQLGSSFRLQEQIQGGQKV